MNTFRGTTALIALMIACQSQAIVLLQDDFSYADGSLTANSGGNWTTHSGTAGQADVVGGVLNLTQAESEDVNRTFASQASGDLFAGVDVNFSALPSGTGSYFMHFKDSTTSGFRGRVFATTTGASAGTYRVGITNASNTLSAVIASDLSLGQNYRVIFSTDAATQAASTVEVLGVGSATASDSVSALVLSSFAFRQSLSGGNGMGTLTADNLIVGTSRSEVVPEPASLLALGGATIALLRRRRKA